MTGHKSWCDFPSDPCDCGIHKREFEVNTRVSEGYDSGYYWGKKASRTYYKKIVKKLKQELASKK